MARKQSKQGKRPGAPTSRPRSSSGTSPPPRAGDSRCISQNPCDYTVGIKHAETRAVVGTGIVTAPHGWILTCRHVLVSAGVNPSNGKKLYGVFTQIYRGLRRLADEQGIVKIAFPNLRSQSDRDATLHFCCGRESDDLVVLRFDKHFLPPPRYMAHLGEAADRKPDNGFRAYAACEAYGERMAVADGDVHFPHVDPPHHRRLQLQSKQVTVGFSGAGVLHHKRNLVIGVITHVANAGRDVAFATDAKTLRASRDPEGLSITVHADEFPLLHADVPQSNVDLSGLKIRSEPGAVLPPKARAWAGREELIAAISAKRASSLRVFAVVGFGGEGKSSLARKWVERELRDASRKPKGVFWCSFYETSVDEFFDKALKFLVEQLPASQKWTSHSRAHLIAEIMHYGDYIFVLDGLEATQEPSDPSRGSISRKDLLEFLKFAALPTSRSFCLITTRVPVTDLESFVTYSAVQLPRLTTKEGRQLLRNLKIEGSDRVVDGIVESWGGHALSLNLVGGLIRTRYHGDAGKFSSTSAGLSSEGLLGRVDQILKGYDASLTAPERCFLEVLCAFRRVVSRSVVEAPNSPFKLYAATKGISLDPLSRTTATLRANQFIHFEDNENCNYSVHPLIREHYNATLNARKDDSLLVHRLIAEYYVFAAGNLPKDPTLEQLRSSLEAVHHFCRAEEWNRGYDIAWEHLSYRWRYVLTVELDAYDAAIDMFSDFFLGRDTSGEPKVTWKRDHDAGAFLLWGMGLCTRSLGELEQAGPFYRRALERFERANEARFASVLNQHLSEVSYYRGEFGDAIAYSDASRRHAESVSDPVNVRTAMAQRALTMQERGEERVEELFLEALRLCPEPDSGRPYLYPLPVFWFAQFLIRRGRYGEALVRLDEVDAFLADKPYPDDKSMALRLRGECLLGENNLESARTMLESAVSRARMIHKRSVLIEALLSLGRFLAHVREAPAEDTLNTALDLAMRGGFVVLEIEIRLELATLLLGDRIAEGRTTARRAQQLATRIGHRRLLPQCAALLDR